MADVSSTLDAWSTTAGSNNPGGSTVIGSGLDDNLRQIQAVVRLLASPNSIASATTTDLSTVNDTFITVSGTTTITGLGTVTSGIYKWLIFSGALTLTHNGTSLILPGAANIKTVAGDIALVLSLGSGNWRCLHYTKVSAPLTTSLSGDVSLSNTSNFFDGPSVSQGTSGTWFVSGAVSLLDTTGSATFDVKLWDGTTIVASGHCTSPATNEPVMIALSGYITNPAADLRISAKDRTSVSGKITFNTSGGSKDSTISAIRIA